MRAEVRTGRSRLLFALLLVLLSMSAAVAPAANGYAERQSAAVAGAPTALSIQNELRDWLRLSGSARHAQAAAAPDTWSAVCAQDPGVSEPQGLLLVGESRASGMAATGTTSRASRAPPFA